MHTESISPSAHPFIHIHRGKLLVKVSSPILFQGLFFHFSLLPLCLNILLLFSLIVHLHHDPHSFSCVHIYIYSYICNVLLLFSLVFVLSFIFEFCYDCITPNIKYSRPTITIMTTSLSSWVYRYRYILRMKNRGEIIIKRSR